MREGAQHKKVERVGKSVGEYHRQLISKLILNSQRAQVGHSSKLCCIVQ